MTVPRPRPVETPAAPSDPPPQPVTAAAPVHQARNRWLAAVAGATLLGLIHALLVAPHYHVGSFDDDANYILVARALATGAGLTTKLNGVVPVVAVYPPGYPALLAPLALLWPHGVLPFRVLSLTCFVALFPLTWLYLKQRQMAPLPALAVLLLLALNPVMATYATMVMAEIPFLVVLLVLLLVLPRWEQQTKALTAAGIAVVLLAVSLIWLKEAGLGLAAGVVLWLALRRTWRKAVLVAAGTVVFLLPVVVARAAAGVSLIGSRYSTELGGPYTGGLVGRVWHLPRTALWTYLRMAVPRSIVPSDVSPLPTSGLLRLPLDILAWTAAPLVIIGFVVWVRRHRDVTSVAVPVYFLETLLFPFTNERRVILVLPVILACYVLGVWAVLEPVLRAARTATTRPLIVGAAMALPVTLLVTILGALLPQLTRDYLYATGQDSSAPAGSPYMAFTAALGNPNDVVETSYLWSTALLSGHRTANAAFNTPTCDAAVLTQALRSDNASFLLSAALNQPGLPDGWCLLPPLVGQPGVVQLYSSPQDLASVFELVGPGTPHPDLTDLTGSSRPTAAGGPADVVPDPAAIPGYSAGLTTSTPAVGGQASLQWAWAQPGQVSQVSLGFAAGTVGTTSVTVSLLESDGQWHQVAASPGAVGADQRTRYLLAPFPTPVPATAVRVTVVGQGPVAVHDLHVLGSRT